MEEVEVIKKKEKVDKPKKVEEVKVVLITSKKANCRFMATNSSRVVLVAKKNEKLKFYREVESKSVLNSNVWYHTEKGYVHSSQAKIINS